MDREAGSTGRPTVADLTGDSHFAQVARANWLSKTPPKVLPNVVESDLWTHLEQDGFSTFSLLLLEQLQTLERYLWPGYTDDASNHHVLLLALLVNVKRQEQLPSWSPFSDNPDAFSSFFRRVLHLSIDQSLATPLRTDLLNFIVGAYQSLDSGLIRKECAPLVSIGIWHNLHTEAVREQHLSKSTQLQKAWRAAGRKYEGADQSGQARLRFERSWLYTLLLDFFNKHYDVEISVDKREENLRYCERFFELLCDLVSQLPTRRYVNTLLDDLNLLPVVTISPLYDMSGETSLLRDMCGLLEHYVQFPVDDQTGRELGRQEFDRLHNAKISRLQKTALKTQPEKLKILVLTNFGALAQRNELLSQLNVLENAEVEELCLGVGLRTQYPEKSLIMTDRAFMAEILVHSVERKPFYADSMQRDYPILPTERNLYDPSILSTEEYTGSRPLALPKLNLQYLTLSDFLWRSFTLHRSEAFYEIRKHIEDTAKRMQPRKQAGATNFNGFSRMAIPISKPAIIDVLPPHVGDTSPAEVKAEIILDVSRLQPGLRREWESLKAEDVVFLLAIQPDDNAMRLTNGHKHESEAGKLGLKTVRCAEVINVLDDNGRVLKHERRDKDEDAFSRPRQRRLLVKLDATSFKRDKKRADAGKDDVYESINVVVRRRARENNFKAVLESIRQLTISEVPIPPWLQEVFLGFGDPSSASYKKLPNRLRSLDYRDSFLDWQHLVEALPGKTLEPPSSVDASFGPPYVLESVDTEAEPAPRPTKKRRREQPEKPESNTSAETLRVSSYKPPNTGPYPTDAPKLNTVRFTPAQVEAITAGTQPGLSLVVGPPGTGKTDVATQVISNIYHNFPQQRTLLVAHSNQALNQLFQKIVALDIDERHLLRLGHGEEELQTDASFSKAGRVDSFLERGGAYLAEVQRLAASIDAPGAHGNSCETAEYFDQVYITPRWKRYWDEVEASPDETVVVEKFPFTTFFADAPQPLFSPQASREEVVDTAKGCERHMRRIFDELADIRPFEILRSQRDKANYLLVKEARIVAMTSTHAAMRRREIAALGFRYENVVMEESAQVTQIEAFIPLALQAPAEGEPSPLQRVVLVGDHLQNAPIVPNAAFRSYANLGQSLFQRLIRLGVPHTVLDAQGRSRPSIAALYQWRYPSLTNLPFTTTSPEFLRANAGFRHPYQFISVPDYNGHGETEPSPHFIQNLGEAEYAVALFQYMRLLGYPAERISILCAYAGQRALVRDVLAHRCKDKRLFGMPGWVGTVDKYQGEQNDYIILSLTRTKTPGYLRDTRRLTVALSRARLGLYVLGRKEVFETSLELREAFATLFEKGEKLALVPSEMWPAERGAVDEVEAVEMEGVEHLGQYVYEMTQAKAKAIREGRGELPPPAETNGEAGEEDDKEEDDDVGDPPEVDDLVDAA